MHLSKRLQAVARMVTIGNRVADVGTDHGYIPIYLIEQGISTSVIAMDIKMGPLQRAKKNILQYDMKDDIQTRLCDGVTALKKDEADTLILAGMGGNVMIHILNEGKEIIDTMKECIFQPQSDIPRFRKYIEESGFKIVKEDMVYEDGKYYPIMKALPGSGMKQACHNQEKEISYRFGELLLEQKHPVLKQYLLHILGKNEEILVKLQNGSKRNDAGQKRIGEIEIEQGYVREALKRLPPN